MEAAAAAQYGHDPPPELELAWAVDYYGAPPDAGGVLDQSVKTTNEIRVSRNVYNAFDSMMKFEGDQKQWSERYPTYWTIVARTQRLRMEMKKNDNNR